MRMIYKDGPLIASLFVRLVNENVRLHSVGGVLSILSSSHEFMNQVIPASENTAWSVSGTMTTYKLAH